MTKHMNGRSMIAAVAAVMLAASASPRRAAAQDASSRQPSRPEIALELPIEAELPSIPEPTQAQERRIASFMRLADRARKTCRTEEERGVYFNEERCFGWYERLLGGGNVAVHAIGRVVVAEARVHAAAPARDDSQGLADLVTVLRTGMTPVAAIETEGQATAERREGIDPVPSDAGNLRWAGRLSVPYLLRAAAIELSSPAARTPHVRMLVSAISDITGHDVAPMAPWSPLDEIGAKQALARSVAGYARWLAAHANESTRAWVAAGLAAARDQLASADATARFAAIHRLVLAARDRARVRASVREMLSAPAVSAEARSYVAAFARDERLLGRAEIRRLASATTSREPS